MRNLLGINGRESWKWREIYLVPPFRAIQLRNILGNEPEPRLSWNFRSTKNREPLLAHHRRSLVVPPSREGRRIHPTFSQSELLFPLSFPSSLSLLLFRFLALLLFLLRLSHLLPLDVPRAVFTLVRRNVHFLNHNAYLHSRDLIRGNIPLREWLYSFPVHDLLHDVIKMFRGCASPLRLPLHRLRVPREYYTREEEALVPQKAAYFIIRYPLYILNI